MAFLLLAIGIIFTLGWTFGLLFSMRSEAPRNPVIPALGVLTFVGVSYLAVTAANHAMDNPARLSAKSYDSVKDGMTMADVEGIFGPALVKPDRRDLDLSGKGVSLPSDIVSRLNQGEDSAVAVNAKLSLSIAGVPSKRNARTGLGAPAANGGNGVVGLQIVLTEGGNETTFTEGEHWTYAPMDTAEAVAKKIGDAINAHPSWTATGSPDSAPKRVLLESGLASNQGDRGNSMTCRAAPTGKNTSVRVGYRDDGSTVAFRGGQNSVALQFWLEKDEALDGDFTMTDRLVVVGYVDNKVFSMKHAGLGTTNRDLADQKAREEAKKATKG